MSGRGGKLAAVLLVAAVAGGIGVGVYTHLPRAAASEPRAAAANPATDSGVPVSAPGKAGNTAPDAATPDTPAPGEPVAVKPGPQRPEPVAPPTLRDDPPKASKPAANVTSKCGDAGPTQLVVEKYLAAHPEYGKVTVDGKQSDADCAAIAKFQQRFGVQPAHGYSGPVTGSVATRLGAAALGSCTPTDHLAVCIDLTSQTMWVLKDGVRILGPTVVRTGRKGLTTPAGHWRVQNKKRDTISTEFKGVHLPYWQRIVGAMGFHETPSYIYEADSPGSHGCVNLLRADAAALFGITEVGTEVHIFGRKPGT
jgi:lipoprotein-anchoring transpeptidase ErfK/SrfK